MSSKTWCKLATRSAWFASVFVAQLAAAQPAQTCAGVSMPSSLEVAGRALQLSGMGKRTVTALRLDVYVAGLYLPEPSSDPAHILGQVPVKHLALHFVRDVSQKEMADALDEGVRNNVTASELASARAKLKLVVSRLPVLKKGLVLGFSQLPDGSLEVRSDGASLAVIRDPQLARLLFSVWLGGHPPSAELQKGLLRRSRCK